ncbi:hypothetical protein COV06_03245 [Candidatus Uhrbacteria bacterium CG10_big_fil_rev_8_21_14_0_10_50_16]|uniref:UPF0235 protein COV06_03245 n=1 Tax=Candidatus Uhrbacteria bacterium CG10_big_fil_rev_8_21_14_0_10_50_16 TaxID=1975039 RepID=A0A2H0RLS3_9BACT|nr:MAG: hypothetical protein COV06_03245 [Candidatus Uhrbacteria bacterium CG10_big_fil_rev_8_21_14_0_10_50_16]
MKLNVKAIPGAQRTEVMGWLDETTVKIRLNAQPEKGKANAELIAFLAKQLGIAKSSCTVLRGTTSRDKVVGLPEREWEELRAILQKPM